MKRQLLSMIYSSLRKSMPYRLYELFLMVFIFFIASCTSNSNNKPKIIHTCLTKNEVKNLRHFLNFLMFENHGAFVMLGSKPLCQISLSDPDSKDADAALQKWLAALSKEEKAKIEAIRKQTLKKPQPDPKLHSHYYKGWLALKKLMKDYKTKNYIFRVVPLQCPDAYDILLINVQQTALVLAENYEIFKEAAEMDFHPLQAVFDAQNPDSVFWKNVFSMKNHVAKGLLFGYGLKNSLFENWELNVAKKAFILPSEKHKAEIYSDLNPPPMEISTDAVPYGEGSLSNFRIPLFGMVQGDKTAEKYRKEKEVIKKIYQDKDIVETTLQYFFSL